MILVMRIVVLVNVKQSLSGKINKKMEIKNDVFTSSFIYKSQFNFRENFLVEFHFFIHVLLFYRTTLNNLGLGYTGISVYFSTECEEDV